MTTFGLTSTGFVPKTLEDVRADINAAIAAYFGPSVDLTNGILARFVAILAERYAELWELAVMIVASQDPDAAAGDALDALCLLTGTLRLEAAYSTVTLTLTGTPSTVVGPASQVASATTSVLFQTVASATLAALPSWVASTAYVVGDRRTNASRCYVCTTAGTSAGSGGPTTTAANITDGTVHWRYLGDGTAAVDSAAQSLSKGAIVGASGDLTVKQTPIGGWQGVINLLDAKLGYDDQPDESLRVTREEELSQAGTSTADAIQAAVLQVANVTACTVFVNNTDVTDSDGMPPHSVEVLVRGGADADVATVLLAQVAAGIATTGNTSATAVDAEGVSHTLYFTRPEEINIGVSVTLIKGPAAYPSDGDAQVKAAIAAFGNARPAGYDAVASAIGAQAFKVAGVLDVTLTKISSVAAPGTPAAPTLSATIAISTRQLAVYDTSWTTVTSSNGTP